MLYTFVTFALALVGAVHSAPAEAISTSLADVVEVTPKTYPIVNLALTESHQNVTPGASGIAPPSTDQIYPATLYLCRSSGCRSCSTFSVANLRHGTCYTPSPAFTFVSAVIDQPSDEGLPFGVFVGPSCSSLYQLGAVNTCYGLSFSGRNFLLTA